MKRLSLFVKILALVVLSLLFLTACSAPPTAIATSMAVQIPLELKVAFNALVLFGVTFGLQWLFEVATLDLRGLGAGLAVAVSEFALMQFQGWIDLVPVQYDIYVTIALGVILSVLTTLGYIRYAINKGRAAEMFLPGSHPLFLLAK